MAKKSNKPKSDPTWDDATVDKHLKPTLAKKKIWWPDNARKKDLIALLKKHGVTLDEVMKGKKPRKYRRPEKPESEDDDEDEESDSSDHSSDDESTTEAAAPSKSSKKKKQDKKKKGESASKKKPVRSGETPKNPRRVQLEEYERAIWEDGELLELLPSLAKQDMVFKTNVLDYSEVVKAHSSHSVTDFWFYTDLILGEYDGDDVARDNAITRFPFRDKVWSMVEKQQINDVAAWDRLRRLGNLAKRKEVLHRVEEPQDKTDKKAKKADKKINKKADKVDKADKKASKKTNKKANKKTASSSYSIENSDSSEEDGDKEDSDEDSGEDRDDSSVDTQGSDNDSDSDSDSDCDSDCDSDSDSDSDGDDGGKRVTYDSKKARAKRGYDSGNPADRIRVEDPESGKIVKADILGRHPSRKAWLVLALPSNNRKYSQLSRGYCVDGTQAKYNKAYERYLEEGSNKTLSTGSDVNLKKCAPSEFELNLVTTIPWGRNVHTHGLGIMHQKKGEFLMFSKQVLGKAWGSRDADDVLRDHMMKAGQSMPGREGKEIRAKSWGK